MYRGEQWHTQRHGWEEDGCQTLWMHNSLAGGLTPSSDYRDPHTQVKQWDPWGVESSRDASSMLRGPFGHSWYWTSLIKGLSYRLSPCMVLRLMAYLQHSYVTFSNPKAVFSTEPLAEHLLTVGYNIA